MKRQVSSFHLNKLTKKNNKTNKNNIAMYDCQKKTDESIPFVF